MNILNIEGWKALNMRETELDYEIDAEITIPPTSCPHCGIDGMFVKFGHKPQVFMDLPAHGKRVGIFLRRKRYRCNNCGRTFLEPAPGVVEGHTHTLRLENYIRTQSLSKPFTHVAEEVGVDEKTVRNIFTAYTQELGKTVKFITPEVLGLDEVHLVRSPRFVACNIKERTIIEMLENRDKKTVIKWLAGLADKEQVQIVTMDMWRPYRDAVREQLPHATVVVDRFHVVKMANKALDTIRKKTRDVLTDKQRRQLMHDRYILQKRRRDLEERDLFLLDTWKGNFPELDMAYELKEALFDIWDLTDRQEAMAAYEAWKFGVPVSQKTEWSELIRAMGNWETEIFNFFDFRYTNAVTETLNGLIKIANRLGRGYSFEAVRAKILYTKGYHKKIKPKFDKSGKGRVMGQPEIPEEKHIPTPAELIVQGYNMVTMGSYLSAIIVKDAEDVDVVTFVDSRDNQHSTDLKAKVSKALKSTRKSE